jgi:hypothetical protein
MVGKSCLSQSALDDRDTKNAHLLREYGCLRGLQPSPADCCCPFGMDCNSVRPRLAHVIMDGWRTIPKSFRCDMARARLRLIDEEITSPVHNPGTRHSVGNARIVNRSRGSKRSELSACPQRVTCGNDAFVTRLYELLTALAQHHMSLIFIIARFASKMPSYQPDTPSSGCSAPTFKRSLVQA